MKKADLIQKTIELQTLGFDSNECSFFSKNFDEISKFFKKAARLKNSCDPKQIIFLTPEGEAYVVKTAIVKFYTFLLSILLDLSFLFACILMFVFIKGMLAVVLGYVLIIASMSMSWFILHSIDKITERLVEKFCKKEIEAVFSYDHKKHLNELGAVFNESNVSKFVKHFYPEIYEEVFNSGWFYTSDLQEIATFSYPIFATELVGYKFLVRKRIERREKDLFASP